MKIKIVLFTIVILCLSRTASAELHEGTVTLAETVSWDFSRFLPVPLEFGPIPWGDFAYASYQAGFERFYRVGAIEEARIAGGRWVYEDLTVAPAPTDPAYRQYIDVGFGGTFVIRTRESHYAKIRVITFYPQLVFDYTYQDDGTRILGSTTPTSPSTWGEIKALYTSDH